MKLATEKQGERVGTRFLPLGLMTEGENKPPAEGKAAAVAVATFGACPELVEWVGVGVGLPVGVGVGFLVISIIMPIYNLTSQF